MRSPAGIALDQEGNVYVADTGNSVISAFTFPLSISSMAFLSEGERNISRNDASGVA